MKELSHREIQLGQLGVLKEFDQICKENGFVYFLYYGTLIGAIRHNGFIPWDDDIDVAMPRPDYERMLDYFRNNAERLKPLVLMHWSTNDKYIYPISRICDTSYYVDYQGAKAYGLGLFIDVYPLDGWGNNDKDTKEIYNRFLVLKNKVSLAGMDRFEKSKTAPWRTIPKWFGFVFTKMHPASYYAKKIDELAKKDYPYEDSDYVGNIFWTNTIGTRVHKSLLKPIKWKFEDDEFPVPSGYDSMLRSTYGDYMKLPPEEDQIAHHYYKAYKLEQK